MIEKVLFNQIGILQIQKKLHALPDLKLAIEVAALRLDFRQWIKNRFDLTPEELTFLDNLNEQFILRAAIRTSNLLALRKYIKLTVIDLTDTPKN